MKRPVVHMIGNAHIDPVWMWQVEEGREEVLSTYRSAIERMRAADDLPSGVHEGVQAPPAEVCVTREFTVNKILDGISAPPG